MHQALRYPPDIAMRIPDAALSVAIGHILNFHFYGRAMGECFLHALICVGDVEIKRAGHGRVLCREFADHDGGGTETYLGIRDLAIGTQGAQGFSTTQPID